MPLPWSAVWPTSWRTKSAFPKECAPKWVAKYQPVWSEAFPEAYVRFKRLDYLEVPELEYRFYGENLDSLHVVAERLMERMREMPELEWVHTDFFQPHPIIDVALDPVISSQLGVTRTTTALALAASTTDLRIGEIAEQCGYRHATHFMRQFKAQMGMTPSEYRSKVIG